MIYLYWFIGFILGGGVLHLIIERITFYTVRSYLRETQNLLTAGKYTDGCSTPFKTYIHRWLSHSHDLCAAHDYGSLGLITVARPGWHNNLITWFAHMSQTAPVYWVWGTIVALVTLPWVVWRRNLCIKLIPAIPFHIFLIVVVIFITIYSSTANAENKKQYALLWTYKMPVERDDGTELKLSEIGALSVWSYDCVNKNNLSNEKIHYINNPTAIKNMKGDVTQYLIHDQPSLCIAATVTDTDGRESSENAYFKIYDHLTPGPVECL
ncbi:MAG: hypothetical protein K0U20_08970 [Proteobacteria bacterium]|nr:hypothetical protein [Pseudomonadota bacterium]